MQQLNVDSPLMLNDFTNALHDRSFHKLIIGAALKDFEQIENFSYLFTHAAVNALDISAFPHSVLNAKAGIARAQNENPKLEEPLIMISVNIGEDPHFRRIVVNQDNCTDCMLCVPSCPSDAFTQSETKSLEYNPDLCFGCSACLPTCSFDALSFENWNSFSPQALNELISLGANAIEIHLNNDLEAFGDFYFSMPNNFILESFCIGSQRMTEDDLRKASIAIIDAVLTKHKSEPRPFIIQTDGIPLSGARLKNDTDKDLISMENARIVLELIPHNYPDFKDLIAVQLAGGITENSLEKAFERKIMVNGVALGSYARRCILDAKSDPKVLAQNLINQSKNPGKIVKK